MTNSPTAEWHARKTTEAFPYQSAPEYLIRDRDRVFGAVVPARACDGRRSTNTLVYAVQYSVGRVVYGFTAP
jgi:hypothetical protein